MLFRIMRQATDEGGVSIVTVAMVPAVMAPVMPAPPPVTTVPTPVAMMPSHLCGHAEVIGRVFSRSRSSRIGERERMRALGRRRNQQQSSDSEKTDTSFHSSILLKGVRSYQRRMIDLFRADDVAALPMNLVLAI
jgi:hypothetical protein